MNRRTKFIIELLVVVVIIASLTGLILYGLGCARQYSYKVRCCHQLKSLATAVNMYLTGIGKGVMYPQPASVFYGDTWLLTLYWEGIVKEPKLFICPATSDDYTKIERLRGKDYSAAIPADAVSYAGRCFGLIKNAWRNSPAFSESGMANGSVLACDDNQGKDNHPEGINVVFFDSHAEFIVNGITKTAYSQIGANDTKWCGGELEKMDSGGGE